MRRQQQHRGFRALLGLLALACAWGGATPAGAEEPSLEYRVQAAYVAKLLHFVTWPEGSAPSGTVQIGVAAGKEFRRAMEPLDGHRVGERVIALRALDSARDVAGLHVLVMGPPEAPSLQRSLLKAVQGEPILTIGSAPDFLAAGGILRFVRVEDTIRFEVDLVAADRARLKLSSRLLRLARHVRKTAGAGSAFDPSEGWMLGAVGPPGGSFRLARRPSIARPPGHPGRP